MNNFNICVEFAGHPKPLSRWTYHDLGLMFDFGNGHQSSVLHGVF